MATRTLPAIVTRANMIVAAATAEKILRYEPSEDSLSMSWLEYATLAIARAMNGASLCSTEV